MNADRNGTDPQANKERTQCEQAPTTAAYDRTATGRLVHGDRTGCEVKLVPLQPPGRITRKARHFEAEIVQLRAQGYTLEAIRQALADAGVHVSISTVRREANRHAGPNAAAAATSANAPGLRPPPPSQASATSAPPAALVNTAALHEQRSGKDLAEAFVRHQSTNPLIRAKEHL